MNKNTRVRTTNIAKIRAPPAPITGFSQFRLSPPLLSKPQSNSVHDSLQNTASERLCTAKPFQLQRRLFPHLPRPAQPRSRQFAGRSERKTAPCKAIPSATLLLPSLAATCLTPFTAVCARKLRRAEHRCVIQTS